MASLTRSTLRRRTIPSSQLLRTSSSTALRPQSPLTTITDPTRQLQHQQPQPRPTRTTQTRLYHSTLHPRFPDHEYTNSQTAILTASLPHIPTHGFTSKALTLGARDAGFLDVSVQLFPRGEFDLILFWLASRRGLLRAKVEEGALLQRVAGELGVDVNALGVTEKVRVLVLERLRMNSEVKGQWQDALAQMSLLGNIPLSLSELHALSNDILLLAGDSSVDGSWYTRRLALSAIYASAEVVMTRDPTPDLAETTAFVERRFEDKEVLKAKVEGVGQCVSFWGNTVLGVGRSFGLKA